MSSTSAPSGEPAARRRFRPRHRLGGTNAFRAVFSGRLRKRRGPLTLHARPNGLAHPRIGLSIGRRVGGAVVRNKLKRKLREAFRLVIEDLPVAPCGEGFYDYVVSCQPHEEASLPWYIETMKQLAMEVHEVATRRQAKQTAAGMPNPERSSTADGGGPADSAGGAPSPSSG